MNRSTSDFVQVIYFSPTCVSDILHRLLLLLSEDNVKNQKHMLEKIYNLKTNFLVGLFILKYIYIYIWKTYDMKNEIL